MIWLTGFTMSSSRLSSVFVEAYGKTPLAYLTMIRAEHLAKYIRETNLTVAGGVQAEGVGHRHVHDDPRQQFQVGLAAGCDDDAQAAFALGVPAGLALVVADHQLGPPA